MNILIGSDVPQSVVRRTGITASDIATPGKPAEVTAIQLGQESTTGMCDLSPLFLIF